MSSPYPAKPPEKCTENPTETAENIIADTARHIVQHNADLTVDCRKDKIISTTTDETEIHKYESQTEEYVESITKYITVELVTKLGKQIKEFEGEDKIETKPKEASANIIEEETPDASQGLPENLINIIEDISECIADEISEGFYTMTNEKVCNSRTEDATGLSIRQNGLNDESDGFVTEEEITTDAETSEEDGSRRTERNLRTMTEYVTILIAEDIIISESRKVFQFVREKVTNELTKYISEYVIDELIGLVAQEVTDVVAEKLTDKITAFITGYISDKVMFNAIVNITRLRMSRKTKPKSKSGLSQLVTEDLNPKINAGTIKEISNKADACFIEKLTDSVANEIVDNIIEKLVEDTEEHLTNYVTDIIADDLIDAFTTEFPEKSTTRSDTFQNESTELTTATISAEKSDEDLERDSCAYRNTEIPNWKGFTDNDFASGTIDVNVINRSFFTYIHVQKNPKYVVNVPKKKTLKNLLHDMVAKNLGANIRIKIGKSHFDCIPSLLKVYSPLFANNDWRVNHFEFEELDVPVAAFELIYGWLRFRTPIQLTDVIKVFQGSRHLQFDLLVIECWNLLSKPNVREKIAFQLFLEADKMPALEDVREILLSRIRGYFLALVGSEEFLNLKLEQLMSLLNRDSIGVNCEVEVFFAAVRWLSKYEKRLVHVKTVMKCVRFAYMPMPMLFTIRDLGRWKDSQPIGTAERVLQEFQHDPDMPKMLYEAMTYISMHFQNEVEPESVPPDDQIKQQLVLPRRWMYHPKCPYHKAKLVYPYQHIITQEDFDNFIGSIQKDWLGWEPPKGLVLDVEFDGVKSLPSLMGEIDKL